MEEGNQKQHRYVVSMVLSKNNGNSTNYQLTQRICFAHSSQEAIGKILEEVQAEEVFKDYLLFLHLVQFIPEFIPGATPPHE